jgi:hypothetical protein
MAGGRTGSSGSPAGRCGRAGARFSLIVSAAIHCCIVIAAVPPLPTTDAPNEASPNHQPLALGFLVVFFAARFVALAGAFFAAVFLIAVFDFLADAFFAGVFFAAALFVVCEGSPSAFFTIATAALPTSVFLTC